MSRRLEAGANTSYSSGVRSVAAGAELTLAMSISGDNEKAAVISTVPVITSGHRYLETRRSFRVCKNLRDEVRSDRLLPIVDEPAVPKMTPTARHVGM